MKNFILSSCLIAASSVLLATAVVAAGNFPTRDIKIIVPFKPGGGVDTTNRIMAEIANKKENAG